MGRAEAGAHARDADWPRSAWPSFETRLSAHAVGRHEAARRHRPRAGDGAGRAADGRAVRGARRDDPPPDAGGAAGAVARCRAARCCSSPIRSRRRCCSATASSFSPRIRAASSARSTPAAWMAWRPRTALSVPPGDGCAPCWMRQAPRPREAFTALAPGHMISRLAWPGACAMPPGSASSSCWRCWPWPGSCSRAGRAIRCCCRPSSTPRGPSVGGAARRAAGQGLGLDHGPAQGLRHRGGPGDRADGTGGLLPARARPAGPAHRHVQPAARHRPPARSDAVVRDRRAQPDLRAGPRRALAPGAQRAAGFHRRARDLAAGRAQLRASAARATFCRS